MMFELTQEQKDEIIVSIKKYISRIENKDIREQHLKKMNSKEFQDKMVRAFTEVRFLSQILVVSIKKMIDYKVVYNKLLTEAHDDIFEVKELKMYIINNLLDEKLPKQYIDIDFKEFQLKEFRKRLGAFKKDYLNMFEE
jgi:hypothetical protein